VTGGFRMKLDTTQGFLITDTPVIAYAGLGANFVSEFFIY